MIYKVKYILATLLLLSISSNVIGQKVYLATGGKVHFFSKTPLEDIEAETQSMTAVLTTVTNKIQFTVPMLSLIHI